MVLETVSNGLLSAISAELEQTMKGISQELMTEIKQEMTLMEERIVLTRISDTEKISNSPIAETT